MSILTAFKVDFDVSILDLDFTSLRKETNIHQDNVAHLYKTDKRVLEKHTKLRDELNNHVNKFFQDTYNFGYQEDDEYINQEFIITTSWLTRLDEDMPHINPHRHTCAFWSGVLYYDDKYHWNPSPLKFESPIPWSSFNFGSPVFSRNIQIQPKTGLCILFPADIYHWTDTIKKDEVRRSLAFNIMPKGLTGIPSSDSYYHPSWLN